MAEDRQDISPTLDVGKDLEYFRQKLAQNLGIPVESITPSPNFSTHPADKPPTQPSGRFLDDAELDAACTRLGLPRVPVLYRGPFSTALMHQYTDGKETVSGTASHIREGIVIRPIKERIYPRVGRVIFKSVSADYLLRKGETTEFQ